jgi:hypothetical protein
MTREKNTKKALRRKLDALIKESGRTTWKSGDYSFSFPALPLVCTRVIYFDRNESASWKEYLYFPKGTYKWKGRQVYFTIQEELYLYERLVLGKSGKESEKGGKYALVNMRKRLGDDFLEDVTEKKNCKR